MIPPLIGRVRRCRESLGNAGDDDRNAPMPYKLAGFSGYWCGGQYLSGEFDSKYCYGVDVCPAARSLSPLSTIHECPTLSRILQALASVRSVVIGATPSGRTVALFRMAKEFCKKITRV